MSYLGEPSLNDGPTGLLFSALEDSGETWTAPKVVMPLESTTDDDPLLKVGDSRIVQGPSGTYHILFPYDLGDDEPGGRDSQEDQIWHTYSTDEGQTWTQPRPMNRSDRGDILSLEIAVDGSGNAHAIYYLTPYFTSPTGNQLRHAVWNGQQWEQRMNVSEGEIIHTGGAALGLGTGPNGCLHLAWSETIERNEDDATETKTRLRYRQIGSGGVCK